MYVLNKVWLFITSWVWTVPVGSLAVPLFDTTTSGHELGCNIIGFTFIMFDSCVMRRSKRPETEAEQVTFIGTVSDEERSIRTIRQLLFRFLKAQRTPVPAALWQKVPAALLGPTVMQQQQLNDLTINGNLTKGSTKYLVYSLKHEELINLDQMQWIIYMAPSCLRRRSMAAKDVRNHQVNCLKEGAYRLRM